MVTRLLCLRVLAGCAIFLGVAMCPRPAAAQAPEAPVLPVEGGIFSPSVQLVEQNKPGVLLTKLRYAQNFDTNAAVSSTGDRLYGSYGNAQGDFTYGFQRRQMAWQLNYKLGGRIYSPKFSDLDTTSHDVRLQGIEQFNSRFSMSLIARYADLPAVGEFLPPPGPPSPSQIGGAEENVPFLAHRTVEEQGSMLLDYKLSEHTSLNFGGNYLDVRYSPSNLLHSRTYSPYMSVFHKLTARQTIGGGYISQWIEFPGRPVRVRVDDFLATYSNAFTQTFSLAVYGGPGWAHLRAPGSALSPVLIQQTSLSLVGGVTVTKTFGHNKFSAKYDRSYSQSSALLGATVRQSMGPNYSRSVTPHLTFALGGNYSRDSGGILGIRPSVGSYRVQASAHYQVRPRILLMFIEAYSGEQQIPQLLQVGNRNVTSVGVEFILPTLAVER